MIRKLPLALSFSLGLALVAIAGPFSAPAQVSIGSGSKISSGGWTVTGTDPIEIRWAGELVTAYQTGKDEPKPYFYPLIGPTGENVTRHWPMKDGVEGEETDHIHHRSLWFGLGKVNGYDFWHEPASKNKQDKKFGKTVHTGMNGMQISGKDQSITFKTTSDWVGFEDGIKILQDKRTFRLQHRDDGSLVIDATFVLEASEGDVNIVDDKEGAFAMRVMPTLRLEGEHAKGGILNNNGDEGKAAWGKRAKWVDYDGVDTQGKELGVAIFDHPTSFRHPSWWHARHYGLFAVNPFGQGNFEKEAAEDAGNYTIKHGDSITLKYRVLIHPGKADADKLNAEYEQFAETE